MKHELIKLKDIPPAGSKTVPFFGRELHVYLNQRQAQKPLQTSACISAGLWNARKENWFAPGTMPASICRQVSGWKARLRKAAS